MTPGNRHKWWWAGCAIGAILIASRIVLQQLSPELSQQVWTDIHGVARSSLAALGLGAAAIVTGRGWRAPATGWLLLSLAMVLWSVGSSCELYASLLSHGQRNPWSDLFYVLVYPFFLAGVLFLPRENRRSGDRLRLAIDLGVAAIAAVVVQMLVIVMPTLASPNATNQPLTLLVSLAYPSGDVLVLCATMILVATGRVSGMTTPSWLLAGGAGLLVVTDTIFGHQLLTNSYQGGNYLGILWTASLVLIGLAGVRAATTPSVPVSEMSTGRFFQRPEFGSLLLSSICFMTAWLVVSSNGSGPGHDFVSVAVLAIIILTVIRQSLALMDNRRLNLQLVQANLALDERVRTRTAELLAAQDQMRQGQKMEAIGRLAGGVAHDFNNLLTVILGNADLALRQTQLDEATRTKFTVIRGAGRRAAELTRQLLTFSRRAPVQPVPLDLAAVVMEVGEMMERLLPAGIRLTVTAALGGAIVRADPGQLVQVVLNLAINARDAMPQGGHLTLSTTLSPDHQHVELCVTDTGTGMDEVTRQRVFEPFFTTKAHGSGTGLGLATVHAIVTQSGGEIAIESAVGRGTTFHITFPVCSETPITVASRGHSRGDIAGMHILLVEDDAAVRTIGMHTLKALGAQVTVAEDGRSAQQVWAAQAGHFDLVITDARMPKVTGPELVEDLRAQGSDCPVIVCSGSGVGIQQELPDQVEILEKPYTVDGLIAAIRRATGRS